MRKALLLLVFFQAVLYCQISKDVFPKIGYYDYYWIYKYYNLISQIDPNSSTGPNYHYKLMSQLGLTHLVTFGDDISLNNSYGLKIIDDNLLW